MHFPPFYVSVIVIIYPIASVELSKRVLQDLVVSSLLQKDAELTVLSAYVLAEWNGQLGE